MEHIAQFQGIIVASVGFTVFALAVVHIAHDDQAHDFTDGIM